ncbi:MAG: RHS repeat-associated core domain-containing protein [Ardenticatenaceae bacterium]
MVQYFPFGKHRALPTTEITDRGYTGHAHNNLPPDGVGLIYMNARYFVPAVGRFASADALVPDPANPQSFNRYGYAYNNPVRLKDPDGHRPCDNTCPGDIIHYTLADLILLSLYQHSTIRPDDLELMPGPKLPQEVSPARQSAQGFLNWGSSSGRYFVSGLEWRWGFG